MESSSDFAEVLAIFKEAGISGFATFDRKKASAKHREWDEPLLQCEYQDEWRWVHPEVCLWHKEAGDPDCWQRCGGLADEHGDRIIY
jgi:hypothetical protein